MQTVDSGSFYAAAHGALRPEVVEPPGPRFPDDLVAEVGQGRADLAAELGALDEGPIEPGGVGAAEASLTAGLVAMGVGSSTAFAIAFTHRLCTYYLPPIWGYFSMQWLQRNAYI